MRTVLGVLGIIFYLGAGISAVAIHLWTCLMFLGMEGWIAAILAFSFPGLSECFMTGITISENGFFNTYLFSILGMALSFGIGAVCIMFSTEGDANVSKEVQ